MTMRRRLILGLFVAAAVAATPAAAAAGQPVDARCWGAASADLAQSDTGALGDHASGESTPRIGLGNVALAFTGTHQPGLLAGALGFDCD
jgi:hypothetical protein